MNRFLISTVIALASCHFASALTVNVTPGDLRRAVSASSNPATETELTVTGSIDASDFDFLREMTSLRSLDLSGATVAAYSGAKTQTGLFQSQAGILPDCALMSGNFTSLSLPSGITGISIGALGGSNVETLVIPPTVKNIGDGAFAGMKKLKSVAIPASVTSMGEMLFKDCPSLESAVIYANIATLPASTFRNCPKLAAVTLPASLTAIGEGAFAGCEALTTIALPTSVTTIGDMAFAASGLTAVDLSGESLREIGGWSFAGCPSLTEITVNGKLTAIGQGAFYNDPSLAVKLGDLAANMTAIPDYLLYGASSASAEGFETTSVESVGKYALSGLRNSKVTLPATLSSLDDNAMERWDNLTEIDAQSVTQVPTLGESVWEDTPQAPTILYVPLELFQAYKDSPQWQDFNVQTETSAKLEISSEDTNGNLRARFDGMLLLIEADRDILSAQLYDISGRCFTIARNPQGNRLTVDTAPFDARVFIVRLLLDDGTTPALKLYR